MSMSSSPLKILAPLALILLTACSGPVEDTRPGQPVKHRQDAFKEILREFEPMGTMLRTQRYEADGFARMAEALHAVREGPWDYFGEDTLYPPSKAKAAVWEKPEVFAARRQDFDAAVTALRAAAGSRDAAQAGAAYEKVHDSCKSCHRDFKK